MTTLHPNILEHDGKKAFVILSYEEFERIREKLDDFEDLKILREAKAEEAAAPVTSLGSVRKEFGI